MREGLRILLVTSLVILYSTYSSADGADKTVTLNSPGAADTTEPPTTINPTSTLVTTTVTTTVAAKVTTPTTENTKAKGTNSNVSDARKFLADYSDLAGVITNNVEVASWAAATDITDEHDCQKVEQELKEAQFAKDQRAKALQFNLTAMPDDVGRQLDDILNIGTSALTDEAKLKKLKDNIAEMESIYSKAKVCTDPQDPKTCLPLDPDITEIMTKSRDYDELLRLWKGWRDVSGRKMRDLFKGYVELSNEAVSELGFRDLGESWRHPYETPTFESDVRKLLDQVLPLYEQLHAFVRRRLREVYGAERFPSTGHIPAHLLGNMWAQEWDGILDIVKPFKDKEALDVTDEMVKQNYTVKKMFETAENFFVSLGMDKMVDTFWTKSMLEKPEGREVVCHASAWDFYDQKDFRIKMCTVITQSDLGTVHHEMGHVQYYMNYKHQPVVYRQGANPGFHEAVGDVMSLSVQTPQHLFKLKLLKDIPDDNETDINFLMNMALQKVAFLPFGYLIDMWRWSVFRGSTLPESYNRDWWDFRCRFQGISSPVERSEEDFDPGAKYHVPANVPYIRYFVSFIIQFQFHKAACQLAGHKGPLHLCDIYQSKEAGEKLIEMLRLGSSQPWPEAMKILTGGEKMDASALMEYFKPLYDFLIKENGEDYGWEAFCPTTGQLRIANSTDPVSDPDSGELMHFSILTMVASLFVSLWWKTV